MVRRRRGGQPGRKTELASRLEDRRAAGPTVVSGLPGSGKPSNQERRSDVIGA
ncbi:hypothetical protein [Amycolatopsis orientalis]|uniref:hypothetical protein n=1 Tax=Amycolatopsis orientalis TaxID=31958 RepID=UPI000ABF2E09|nr:hypothetical protein [Amycolatopsis orientalis]